MTPEGRKTTRLAVRLTVVGLALGGAAGARLGMSRASVFPLGALLRSRDRRHKVFAERERRTDAGHSLTPAALRQDP